MEDVVYKTRPMKQVVKLIMNIIKIQLDELIAQGKRR